MRKITETIAPEVMIPDRSEVHSDQATSPPQAQDSVSDSIASPGQNPGLTLASNASIEELWFIAKRDAEDRAAAGIRLPNFSEMSAIINAGRNSGMTDEMFSILGTIPDAEAAEKLGTSLDSVKRKRKAAGIPSFAEKSEEKIWTKEATELLGRDYDIYVAKKIGVSAGAVKNRRVKLGIPKFSEKKWCRVCEKPFFSRSVLAKSCQSCKDSGADEPFRRDGSKGGDRSRVKQPGISPGFSGPPSQVTEVKGKRTRRNLE